MLNLDFEPFPVLETERLQLRQMQPPDAADFLYLRSADEVMRFIDRPRLKSLAESVAFMEKLDLMRRERKAIFWGIYLKNDPRLIGNVLLWGFKDADARGEIGYVMHPDYQRQGLTGEAVDRAINFGFDRIGLHSIEAQVLPNNPASVALLEGRGFKQEGYFRDYYFFEGKFKDLMFFSLLKEEWG